MKKSVILIALIGIVNLSYAQTWDEFFRQKKTQKKYLLQQIAALQVYTGYLEKGYKIVHTGLDAINSVKHGYFNVFTVFFGSLSKVNPTIRHYAKVADILGMQLAIAQQTNVMLKQARNHGLAEELPYIENVFSKLLDGCNSLLDELITVMEENKLKLSDDERIKRIDKLYADMQDKQMFCAHFSNGMQVLFAQRLREQNDITDSRALHGLK